MEVVTRFADRRDLGRAADVLGDAFADYPWTRWTVDHAEHQRRIVALQRLALEHVALPYGSVSVTTIEGTIHSVAAWVDSESSAAGGDAAVARQIASLEGDRHHASRSADREVAPLRPTTRHLSLGTVGTSPALQGRGLGTRTLAPLLRLGDERSLAVCLETSSSSNVEFYRRLGFDVDGHLVVKGGGPAVWLMMRPPGAGKAPATHG